MRDDFAVFILSHGRAGRVYTIDAIKRCGYNGKYYIIVDNEDDVQSYINEYGEDTIIVFDKLAISKECDTCDTIEKRNTVLFARNVCHKIANDLGITYFMELDDDYHEFRSRILDDSGKLSTIYVRDMDKLIDYMIEFLDVADIRTVAFAQTGDFIGGADSKVYKDRLSRKSMNAYFCRADRPFQFIGRFNDDVNTYIVRGSRGELFFTIADISVDQTTTQANKGGLTDMYLEHGTYVKSFYSVINCPSFVDVYEMGCSNKRLHHRINWECAVPKIISSDFKK